MRVGQTAASKHSGLYRRHGTIQRDDSLNPGKAIPSGVLADYSMSVQHYRAFHCQQEISNPTPPVQAFTDKSPAGSAWRTSGADDRN